MDGGAWQATVRLVTELDTTEQLTLTLRSWNSITGLFSSVHLLSRLVCMLALNSNVVS